MQRIERDQAKKYAFDWDDAPVLRVQPGESFVVETWDASTGYFKTEADLAIPARRPGFDRMPPLTNPLGGPIYVEGASRGDVLAVTVEEILVADYSWCAIGPGRGPLGTSTRWPELSQEYTTRIFRHEPGPSGTMRDGTMHLNDRVSWPITPFIGTIGVAPDREVLTSACGQGEWGGNIDCRHITTDATVYFPVFHDGALFYLGDIHASQGDTEFTGTAAETCADVRVRCEVKKGKSLPYMRLETPDALVALHFYRPLEVAVETAIIRMMEWLVEDYGFSQKDAYLLASTCPDLRVNVYQMCRLGSLNYVAGAELPKRYLG